MNAAYKGLELMILICSLGLPKQHRLVKWVAAYCVLGYVVVMICFLAVWCRPIQWYWAVPALNCMSLVTLIFPFHLKKTAVKNLG